MASAKVAAAPPSGITGAYVTAVGSTANASSFTFSGVSIGNAPSATRRIVLAIAGRDTASYPTSVTVGGVALTRDGEQATTQVLTIWSGVVPTGTTAEVVVTYPGTQTFCGVGVWALSGGAPVASAGGGANSGSPSLSLATQAGDFCVAGLAFRASVAGPNIVWTGLTERYDAAVDGAVRQHSGGDVVATGGTTNISAAISNYGNESALAAVAYR